MYSWPIVLSKNNTYPLPNYILRYIPEQVAIDCYLKGKEIVKMQNSDKLLN